MGSAGIAQEPREAPQVRIEARVLEWQINKGSEFDFAVAYRRSPGSGGILRGMDLNLASDPPLESATRLFLNGISAGKGAFDIVVEALETEGRVVALASPSIILTSRQAPMEELAGNAVKIYEDRKKGTYANEMTGHVHNTQQIPYETAQASGNRLVSFTEYQDSGLTLDVTVQRVMDDGLVVLDLNTRVKDLTGFIRVGLNERNEPLRVPTFDTREIQNRLIIPDGTVFLAGLMKTTRQSQRRRGIPWLSEIPPLSWLISNKKIQSQETELIFLIQPEILAPQTTLADSIPMEGDS